MRWYEWPLLWLAFFVPCTIILPVFSQVSGPLRPYPERQLFILLFVSLSLTLLVGWVNIWLRQKRNR
jgi:hypothetical protein